MFWPFAPVTVRSRLAPEDVSARLRAAVDRERRFRPFFSRLGRPFEGVVRPDRFRIRRILGYRNALLPLVEGTIARDGRGSTITVAVRPGFGAALALAAWLGLSLAAALSVPSSSPVTIFGWAFIWLGFHAEASRARRFVERVAGC